jgi:4-hydroxy-3-methylbut-2-enyl diphosphate reductase
MVVEGLKARGACFVEDISEIPPGAVTIFSAHGVPRTIESAAVARNLHVIDATCPLVTKVHREGQRYAARGFDVVLIGHAGHPEVEGTMGQINGPVYLVTSVADVASIKPRDPVRIAYVTQTTLSVDDTREIIAALTIRFPNIVGPDVKEICYATQNRQTAVKELSKRIDLTLVVGAHNSSNSNRLREVGHSMGKPSYLIEDATALRQEWLENSKAVGVTAGTSTPETLVQEVLEKLAQWCSIEVEVLNGIAESVHFKLPEELVKISAMV